MFKNPERLTSQAGSTFQ